MKTTLLTTAAFTAASTALLAQTLSITAPGYSGARIFDATPGFALGGLAAAPGGEVFYIESDNAPTLPASTKLYRRSAGDGYATATPLFDFGAPVFGSFVRWESGRVFFGDSTGAVRVLNANLSIGDLGSVPFNYDAAFSDGSLFLSHNPGGNASRQNKVTRFALLPDGSGGQMLGAADTIVDTPNDYSGPLEFDAAGNLFYGGTFARPGLYRFTADDVTGAFGAGPTQTLDSAHLFLANGPNAALAYDDAAALWHSDYATLDLIDLATATSAPVGSSPNFIGQLDVAEAALYAVVTDFGTGRTAVFRVVPEPSATLLLTLGLAVLTPRRRRRQD